MEHLNRITMFLSDWRRFPRLRVALIGVLFIAGYLLLDWISYIYPTPYYNITPWNPQPALAIALLMIGGWRWLPAVFAATVAAAFIARGEPIPASVDLLIASVLTLGYFAIARLLTQIYPITLKLGALSDIFRLMGVVTIGSLILGLAYSGILVLSGIGPLERFPGAVLRFWIGNSVGILVALPLLFMFLDPSRRLQIKGMLWRGETIVQVLAIGIVLWSVFQYTEDFKLFYLLFLPLVWIATRSGMAGTALATALIQGGVILAIQASSYQTLTVFELQALLMALTITGFFLGVTVEERQRAGVELRESLRLAAAGEMAATLAHELNQPLTAVSSYAKASRLLAASGNGGHRQLMETLEKLVSETTRAAEVVRRLRDFFNTGATHLQNASLPQLVENVIQSVRRRALEMNVKIKMKVAEAFPTVLVDPLQIEVVIRNLVANAMDAVADDSANPRLVSIEIDIKESGEIQLTVIDSGPGITLDRMEHLFEPFSTTKATGMGMGLAISRAIIEGHGGRLWAKPGNHGVLCFTLPPREVANG